MQLLEIFQKAKPKVEAGEPLLPALGKSVDEVVLSWPRFTRRPDFDPGPWPRKEIWNGAVTGARRSILQNAIAAIDTVVQDKVKKRPSGREMLTYGGLRQYPMMPTGVTKDGRPFYLFHTDATLKIPQSDALAALDRAINILVNQEEPVYVKPVPSTPPVTEPDPVKPTPVPIAAWKHIDGQGGLVDLVDWAAAVGGQKTVAVVTNATRVKFWQYCNGPGDRCQIWKRADGRYQLVESHATGNTILFEGLVEIAFGRSNTFVSMQTRMLPSSTRSEPEWPVLNTIPEFFPPNPFGFHSTQGLTMAEFDRVKAFLSAAEQVKLDPAAVQTAVASLEVANVSAKLFEPEQAAAIGERNGKVAAFLGTLVS